MTVPHRRPDAVDRAAGIAPESPLFALRADRPQYLEGAEACRAAVLAPADDLGLAPALRRAVVARVGQRSGRPDLLPEDRDPDLKTLAEGGHPAEPLLAAIARHADLIAVDPRRSSASHLADLAAAGLTTPQIVALSELLAYACFHIRVAHGLSLLKDPA